MVQTVGRSVTPGREGGGPGRAEPPPHPRNSYRELGPLLRRTTRCSATARGLFQARSIVSRVCRRSKSSSVDSPLRSESDSKLKILRNHRGPFPCVLAGFRARGGVLVADLTNPKGTSVRCPVKNLEAIIGCLGRRVRDGRPPTGGSAPSPRSPGRGPPWRSAQSLTPCARCRGARRC